MSNAIISFGFFCLAGCSVVVNFILWEKLEIERSRVRRLLWKQGARTRD